MLIKIAIFTIIGLSAVALSWLWGPGLWRKLRRASLERKLAEINANREYVQRLQCILDLPNAYELLLVEGIVSYNGSDQIYFFASPEAQQVRRFIDVNRTAAIDDKSRLGYRLSYTLESLHEQEDRVQAALYVMAARDRPANRELYLIEQRAKIGRLEHQLAAEREQLERLEARDRSPDPYGRVPKMRLERYVPIDATETKKAPHSRKKRA